MKDDKVPITLDWIENTRTLAEMNGTLYNWIGILWTWAKAAEKEIIRLQKIKELKHTYFLCDKCGWFYEVGKNCYHCEK